MMSCIIYFSDNLVEYFELLQEFRDPGTNYYRASMIMKRLKYIEFMLDDCLEQQERERERREEFLRKKAEEIKKTQEEKEKGKDKNSFPKKEEIKEKDLVSSPKKEEVKTSLEKKEK